MSVPAFGPPLRWSDEKIAQVEDFVAATSVDNFVHWTAKAELYAARGDTASARFFIEFVMRTWSRHHATNDHFLAEVAVATCVMGDYHVIYDIFAKRFGPDWQFEIQIVENLSTTPFVIEWEIVSRTKSIFRFDAEVYRSDATHHIFLNWTWCFLLFDAYHSFLIAISGKTLISFGDVAASPGLAFSSNRPDVFLVPDYFFLSKIGYKHEVALLERNWINWSERRPVVLWRGTTTGIRLGDWRTLQRIKLCEMARDATNAGLFDVGISNIVQLPVQDWIAEIESSGLMRPHVPSASFGACKYLIDIDGNSNSWEGLFLKLCTGSPVMKIASPVGFRQWYYDKLEPWVNYVPVAADMSDLAENAAWLQTHDDHAELIGKRGRALAQSLTYESQLAGAAQTITNSIQFFRENHRLAAGPG